MFDFEDIEKSFDSAFFNADHHLREIIQIVANFEDVITEDLTEHISGSLSAIGAQLQLMVFNFAQLMSKSILYSENFFILKERFQKLQLENFNFKSDKYFMDFVRKLNVICSTNGSSSSSKSSKKPIDRVNSNSPTARQSPVRRGKPLQRNSPSSPGKLYRSKGKDNKENKPGREGLVKSQTPKDGSTQIYFPPKDGQPTLDDHLLNNSNRNVLKNSATFRMHRLNNDAIKRMYCNFKEAELINEINFQNVTLQKETVILKSELANYRLVVRYLNNQMSGRIQQIQLLNREKKDTNFEQVWSDLESEIQLNKYKTIVQALASNQEKPKEASSIFSLINAASVPNSPSIIRPKAEVSIEQARAVPSSIDSSDVSLLEVEGVTTATTNNIPLEPNDALCSAFEEESLAQLKNFKQSFFNVGLLRFVFVNLADEAIGISVIGGKEYNLPILISEIHPETPAARTGAFRPGEIILSVNFVDLTDLTHEEAVDLLTNLSGNTRFGVIYFKPDDPQMYPKDEFCSLFPSSHLSPALPWSSSVSSASLLQDYYRSAFNTFLSAPTFQPPSESDNSSVATSDSEDDDRQSCFSLSDDSNDDSAIRQVCDKETKTHRVSSSLSSPLIDLVNTETANGTRKAVPGMAARLAPPVNSLAQ